MCSAFRNLLLLRVPNKLYIALRRLWLIPGFICVCVWVWFFFEQSKKQLISYSQCMWNTINIVSARFCVLRFSITRRRFSKRVLSIFWIIFIIFLKKKKIKIFTMCFIDPYTFLFVRTTHLFFKKNIETILIFGLKTKREIFLKQ